MSQLIRTRLHMGCGEPLQGRWLYPPESVLTARQRSEARARAKGRVAARRRDGRHT